MNSIKFSASVCSNKGRIRANNEDNFYFNGINLTPENRDKNNFFSDTPSEDVLVFGVFDGMGGEALGEDASLIAAQSVKKYHEKLKKDGANDVENAVLKSISDANTKICNRMVESGEKRIGTTFAALCICDDTATVYNVGDSRVYLYRNKKLKQISVDDTTVQRLINMGVITKEKAKTHEDRHKLTQHLGIFRDEMIIEPHISDKIAIEKGDRFILCSDGLTDMVGDDEIQKIMQKTADSKTAAKKLLLAALKNGGRDNVTVTVVSADTRPAKKRKSLVPILAAVLAVIAAVLLIGKLSSKPKEVTPAEFTIDERNYKKVIKVGEWCSPSILVQEGQTSKFHFESSAPEIVETDDKRQGYRGVTAGEAVVTVSMGNVKKEITIQVEE